MSHRKQVSRSYRSCLAGGHWLSITDTWLIPGRQGADNPFVPSISSPWPCAPPFPPCLIYLSVSLSCTLLLIHFGITRLRDVFFVPFLSLFLCLSLSLSLSFISLSPDVSSSSSSLSLLRKTKQGWRESERGWGRRRGRGGQREEVARWQRGREEEGSRLLAVTGGAVKRKRGEREREWASGHGGTALWCKDGAAAAP